jgi:5-methyltetrahydrofolate--homocysteine methyltransferase
MPRVFLYHAIQAGLDMGIVNAGDLPVYDDIPVELREAVEDVILNRPQRTNVSIHERWSTSRPSTRATRPRPASSTLSWREAPVAERIKHALVHGVTDWIERTRGGAPGASSARCTSSRAR